MQVARHALHWRGVHGRRPKCLSCLSEVVANAASCPIASGGLVGRRGKDEGKDAVGVGGAPSDGRTMPSSSSSAAVGRDAVTAAGSGSRLAGARVGRYSRHTGHPPVREPFTTDRRAGQPGARSAPLHGARRRLRGGRVQRGRSLLLAARSPGCLRLALRHFRAVRCDLDLDLQQGVRAVRAHLAPRWTRRSPPDDPLDRNGRARSPGPLSDNPTRRISIVAPGSGCCSVCSSRPPG